MAGISETLDLDISAALAKVRQLGSAVDKAAQAKVDVHGGAGSAATGLRSVSKEAAEAQAATSLARKEFSTLASTAAGTLSPSLGLATSHLGEIRAALGGASNGALALGAGLVAVGVVLAKMTLSGVGEFVKLGNEIRGVQRVTGGTAKEASQLTAVFHVLGVSTQAGATSMLRFSENIRKHEDVLRSDGIAVARNKDGQVNLTATILNVSDAYRAAGSQIERTKIVVDTFGLRGKALIPILAAGREQIEEFWRAAAAHHEIFSQADLDRAREYKIATYELGEAFGGLERELGAKVVPVLTAFARGADLEIRTFDRAFNAVGRFAGGLLGLGRHHASAAEEARKLASEVAKVDAAASRLAEGTGVTSGRIQQLASKMGVDLSNATDKETKKLTDLAASLNTAVTPTQKLAEATVILSNKESTAAESVKAMKLALDATLDAHLAARTATIDVTDAVRSLGEEYGRGVKKGEDLVAHHDRIVTSTAQVVKAIEAEAAALVNSGQLDAAGQADYLRERLSAVGEAVPAVRAEIALYVADLDKIPTARTTVLDVDAEEALRKIGLVNFAMSPAGRQSQIQAFQNPYVINPAGPLGAAAKAGLDARTAANAGANAAKALADSLSSATSLHNAAAAGERLGSAAAGGAAKAIEKTLMQSGKPGEGLDLGGFIAKGIDVGAATNAEKAKNATLRLIAGMRSVVDTAEKIDPAEKLGILEAVKNVAAATNELAELRKKKLGPGTIEYALAEGKLRQAQGEVNTKLREAVSAGPAVANAQKAMKESADKLTDSLRDQRDAIRSNLDAYLGSLSAVRGLASAQRALRDASREQADAQKRSTELPGEIAKAEAALDAARSESAKVTSEEALSIVEARKQVADAEKNLDTLRKGSSASVNDLVELTLRLKDAREKLSSAEAIAAGRTDEVVKAEADLAAARRTLVPEVVAAAEAKLAEARAKAAAQETGAKLAVIEAGKNVTAAEKALTDASAGSSATSADLEEATLRVAVARDRLNDATKESTADSQDVVDAQQKIKDLQDEAAHIADRLADATDAVTDAQLGLVEAQRGLIEAGGKLAGSTDSVRSWFRTLALEAGLSKDAVDRLIGSLDTAASKTSGAFKSSPLAAPGFTGLVSESDINNPYYVPPGASSNTPVIQQYRTPAAGYDEAKAAAQFAADQRWAAQVSAGKPWAGGGGGMFGLDDVTMGQPYIGNVNFNVQQATIDEADVTARLRNLELLRG